MTTTGEEARKLLFEEMTQITLWGNATDLSLLSKLSLEDIQRLQGSAAIAKNQRNIVVNDTSDVWQYLSSSQPPPRVDIVLDNSGFEFFTDLVYASFLLRQGLTDKVVMHIKQFPWFVSDVTPQDVVTTLADLASPQILPDRDDIDPLLDSLKSDFSSGRISTRSHPFWTKSCSFQSLPETEPELFQDLQSSGLVIFKGDLNYRKLLNDGHWPYTTPFSDALGPLGHGSNLRILALRTNKADVCVGLSREEEVKRLEGEAPNSAWTKNGKYAVVSFSDGTMS